QVVLAAVYGDHAADALRVAGRAGAHVGLRLGDRLHHDQPAGLAVLVAVVGVVRPGEAAGDIDVLGPGFGGSGAPEREGGSGGGGGGGGGDGEGLWGGSGWSSGATPSGVRPSVQQNPVSTLKPG